MAESTKYYVVEIDDQGYEFVDEFDTKEDALRRHIESDITTDIRVAQQWMMDAFNANEDASVYDDF